MPDKELIIDWRMWLKCGLSRRHQQLEAMANEEPSLVSHLCPNYTWKVDRDI